MVYILRWITSSHGKHDLIEWNKIISFQLQFDDFHLESENWRGDCNFDYVSVYEGSNSDDKNLIKTICGKVSSRNNRAQLKHNFISESGEMFIKFFSDNTVSIVPHCSLQDVNIKGTEKGFLAKYRSIPDDVPVRTGYILQWTVLSIPILDHTTYGSWIMIQFYMSRNNVESNTFISSISCI